MKIIKVCMIFLVYTHGWCTASNRAMTSNNDDLRAAIDESLNCFLSTIAIAQEFGVKLNNVSESSSSSTTRPDSRASLSHRPVLLAGYKPKRPAILLPPGTKRGIKKAKSNSSNVESANIANVGSDKTTVVRTQEEHKHTSVLSGQHRPVKALVRPTSPMPLSQLSSGSPQKHKRVVPPVPLFWQSAPQNNQIV